MSLTKNKKLIRFNLQYRELSGTRFTDKEASDRIPISKAEVEISSYLQNAAPGVVDPKTSVILSKPDEEFMAYLFDQDIAFKNKQLRCKNYLVEPNKACMVRQLPTHETSVVRMDPVRFEIAMLLYALQCVLAVFPALEHQVLVVLLKVGESLQSTSEDVQLDILKRVKKDFETIRGLNSGVSVVMSAAIKVWYTVDGLAFDAFSIILSATEWDQITLCNNRIKLKYADSMREMQTAEFHANTSKTEKIRRKRALDAEISKEQIPLVKIMKLNLEDFHHSLQLKAIPKDLFNMESSKVKFNRKEFLALAKRAVLSA